MKLNNKAETLRKLSLKKSQIPKLKIYKVENFIKNKEKTINDIKFNFKSKIAIRSSSKEEDQSNKSNAGKFKSYLNINPKNVDEVEKRISNVIKSYKKNVKSGHFFVQEMVKNASISGVVLTRNLENYARCFNVNYFLGKDSTNVTSGKKGSKNLIYFENSKYKIDNRFKNLVKSINEIKIKTKNDELDIEFIIDKKKKIHILQVRNLIIPKTLINKKNDELVILEKLEKKIKKLKKEHYSLYGKTTFFGVMPDWNPAEIIGIKPKPLALSLYKELVTDHVWSENRKIYGYRDLSQFHLMTTFYGTPYIDIRVDFNSWIPSSLPKNISNKLVNFYLKIFKKNQYLHDKIEFEVVFTCLALNTKKKIDRRLKNFFTTKEKKILIKNLTKINKIALTQVDKDLATVEELKVRQNLINNSSLYYIDKIYWLVEDCKKFGTLPFAGLARCGFISTEILNSFVEEKIFTEVDKLNFLASIKTIASEISESLSKNKNIFIKKYGHLRPGTYEISSLNYKDNFKNYFYNYKNKKNKRNYKFIFTKSQKDKINLFIKKNKIYNNFDELILFIKKSIKYREYSKFIFSKSIDMIFQNLEGFGKKYSIKKEDLSFIKIFDILELYSSLSGIESIRNIKKRVYENKKEYLKNKNIILPDIITSGKDLFLQNQENSRVNFISNKVITGKIIEYNEKKLTRNLDGIICIESADPGFDFLFTKNIKGLVTKYGGQNSHMAIRCAELNIPALIGVGEQIYNKIVTNKSIKIDCVLKKIDLIN